MQTKQDCVLWCAAECFRAEEVFVLFFFTCESFYVEHNFMKHRNVLLRSLLQTASSRRASVEMEEPKRVNGDLVMDRQGREETLKEQKMYCSLVH